MDFVQFKTQTISQAVSLVAANFLAHLDEILQGKEVQLLPKTSETGDLLQQIKTFAQEKIYTDRSVEQIELAGRSAINGLLDNFSPLLQLEEGDFIKLLAKDRGHIKTKQLDFHARLLHRISTRYIEKYKMNPDVDERKRRAHLIVDFISGMTDDFALETYQIFNGIKIR